MNELDLHRRAARPRSRPPLLRAGGRDLTPVHLNDARRLRTMTSVSVCASMHGASTVGAVVVQTAMRCMFLVPCIRRDLCNSALRCVKVLGTRHTEDW